MFTPCWPRAGPTGRAGVACPAGSCSFTIALTSLAMASSGRLHLPVLELDRGLAAEDGHDHAHEALGVVDLVDDPVVGLEGPLVDLHAVADLEVDAQRRALVGLAHAREDALDLVLVHGHRHAVGADEVADARGLADQEP